MNNFVIEQTSHKKISS